MQQMRCATCRHAMQLWPQPLSAIPGAAANTSTARSNAFVSTSGNASCRHATKIRNARSANSKLLFFKTFPRGFSFSDNMHLYRRLPRARLVEIDEVNKCEIAQIHLSVYQDYDFN